MIASADPAAQPGDVVAVVDRHGEPFGRALYNPRSQIALRMLTWDEAPIDDAFWDGKLKAAIELRRMLRVAESTDAYRLVHAEGDGLSGLIVERYASFLVFELFSLGMFQRWEHLAHRLIALLGDPPTSARSVDDESSGWSVLARADARVESLEGFRMPPPALTRLRGSDAEPKGRTGRVVVHEHGVRYRVDMAGGHKTGFFCDQRENRRRFAQLVENADVLDVCCYTGGFSLCAKKLGRARSVTAVDLDEEAIALARENGNLNQVRVDWVHADAFGYLRQMHENGRMFDAVVLDPPKLALSREGLAEALRKYHDLNMWAMRVVRPGGVLLTCSCSGLVSPSVFIDTVLEASRSARREAQLFDRTRAAPDHPVMLNCPESEYLKAVWLRVR